MPTASNHTKTDPKTFGALDDLPPELRREVCFAARVWDAILIANLYSQNKQRRSKAGAISWLIASIQAGDQDDLRDFAMRHRQKYGHRLPCVAAEATILRYRPPVNTHTARPRRAIPLDVRAAWRSSERLMPREGIDEALGYRDPSLASVEGRFEGLDFLPAQANAAAV